MVFPRGLGHVEFPGLFVEFFGAPVRIGELELGICEHDRDPGQMLVHR